MTILPHRNRIYKCRECGNRVTLNTNHIGPCYPFCLYHDCFQIVEDGRGGFRARKQTEHVYDPEVVTIRMHDRTYLGHAFSTDAEANAFIEYFGDDSPWAVLTTGPDGMVYIARIADKGIVSV